AVQWLGLLVLARLEVLIGQGFHHHGRTAVGFTTYRLRERQGLLVVRNRLLRFFLPRPLIRVLLRGKQLVRILGRGRKHGSNTRCKQEQWAKRAHRIFLGSDRYGR